MRADAEANLERIVRAAEDVFAQHGVGASIELVAERAGVGLGTIYRHFANKDALVTELVNRLLAEVVAVGERHLNDPDGSGMANYMVEVGVLLASSRGVVARLWSDPSSRDLVARSVDDGRGSAYSVGQRVFHLKFGYGTIEQIEGNKLSIDFEKAGKKKVLESFVQKA